MASVDNSAWDASKAWANGAAADDPSAFYKGICAGEKTDGDPDTQAHWALPHHYHPGDPPNAAGVRNGLSRISQTQGLKNKSAAQKHLDNHMATIQAEEKAAGRANLIRSARAEYAQRGEVPGGQRRTRAFPGRIQARIVERDGRQFYHVDGFATIFERGYEMWDMFGSYTEIVDARALDETLAQNPDVAWLVNHRGVTMARTTNGTLELSKSFDGSYQGLHTNAYLNPERQDVRDIVSAINDELIDEMSFAFMLTDGEWNDDYDEFRITKVDINRGDVSAVNYGANPFTSIQARAADWLADAERMPVPVARAAMEKFLNRRDSKNIFDESAEELIQQMENRYRVAAQMNRDAEKRNEPKPVPEIAHKPGGKPVNLWRIQLESWKEN